MPDNILPFQWKYGNGRQTERAEQEFSELFKEAQEIAVRETGERAGRIMTVTAAGLETWFQRRLASEVFEKRHFDRSVLMSLAYVAGLLTRHSRGAVWDNQTLVSFADEERPERVLCGGEQAFIIFCFHPDERVGRPIRYRQYALAVGQSFYSRYSSMTDRSLGYNMAEAFGPIGEIVREQFAVPAGTVS